MNPRISIMLLETTETITITPQRYKKQIQNLLLNGDAFMLIQPYSFSVFNLLECTTSVVGRIRIINVPPTPPVQVISDCTFR